MRKILRVSIVIMVALGAVRAINAENTNHFREYGLNYSLRTQLSLERQFDFRECQYDKFAVTGYTRNSYGTNYSISLRVTGISSYYGNSISRVEYNDGSSWVSTSYTRVIGEEDTYRVNVGGNTYYFTF